MLLQLVLLQLELLLELVLLVVLVTPGEEGEGTLLLQIMLRQRVLMQWSSS